jgi:hypothetical protein
VVLVVVVVEVVTVILMRNSLFLFECNKIRTYVGNLITYNYDFRRSIQSLSLEADSGQLPETDSACVLSCSADSPLIQTTKLLTKQSVYPF